MNNSHPITDWIDMASAEIEEQAAVALSNAYELIDAQMPYLSTRVLNIGKAVSDSTRQSVVWVEKDAAKAYPGAIRFRYNPNEVIKFTVGEIAFMIVHECMHIELGHLSLLHKESVFDDKETLNIATDMIINDYLASQRMSVPEGAFRGRDIGIANAWNSSLGEVYDAIEDLKDQQEQEQQQQNDADGDNEGDEQGTGGGGEGTEGGDGEDQGKPESGDDPLDQEGRPKIGDPEALEDLANSNNIDNTEDDDSARREQNKTNAEYHAQQGHDEKHEEAQEMADHAGGSGTSSMYSFDNIGVSLNWVELIRKVNPKAYSPAAADKRNWGRQSRKGTHFYPDALIPSWQNDNEKEGDRDLPSVVLAVDVSGSIPDPVKRKFLGLARSIRSKEVKVHAMAFDHQYRELDLDKPMVYGGGGTNGSTISDYIIKLQAEKKISEYPHVIVFTDGELDFDQYRGGLNSQFVKNSQGTWDSQDEVPNSKELSKWSFLLFGYRSEGDPKPGVGWDNNAEFTKYSNLEVLADYEVKKS